MMTSSTNETEARMAEMRAEIERPSQEQLLSLLTYNQRTGILRWKARPAEMFTSEAKMKSWNTRYSGKKALHSVCSRGYRSGRLLGRYQKAHRVIWVMIHGEWPNEVDHINGIKCDNRLKNLRDATHSQNQKNQPLPKNNKSGVIGVSWRRQTNVWRAQISSYGKRIHLGCFKTIREAANARAEAEKRLGFHPNHGRVK